MYIILYIILYCRCAPATLQEKLWTKDLNEGGTIQLYSSKNTNEPISKFEYLLAHFGSKVLHSNVTRNIVMSKPAEACDPLEKDVKGKIVVVRRGSCPFVQKAENVQNAGGVAVIVSSLNTHIFRMGVEPRWKGLNTAIPVISVTKNAYKYDSNLNLILFLNLFYFLVQLLQKVILVELFHFKKILLLTHQHGKILKNLKMEK